MPARTIDRNAIRLDEDWEGNNAAFTCPLCKIVFLVSGLLHGGRRTCPNPKCGKSTGKTVASAAGAAAAVGHRHGRRSRSIIAVPRARLEGADGTTTEWRSSALRAYQRRTLVADALIASTYLRHQHTSGPPGARGAVWRGGGQGHGEPGVAQGEDRLGCLEHPFADRRANRAAHSRRHRGTGAARPQSDRDLAACRYRRAGRRQKVLLAIKSMGGESTEAWRTVLDDLIKRGLRRPEFLIVDGAPGLEKAIAAVWDGVPVQRCTVHKHRNLLAHAPERLHEEITADYSDMIYAATHEEIEARRKAFIRKWRLKHRAVADSLEEAGDRLFAFTRLPPSQWRSARTTNAIERLHEEFKRRIKTQTVLPSADTAAMLFWALLASGQINMRKVDGWQTLATKPVDQPIDLAA